MNEPKQFIYELLSTLDDVDVYPERPNEFKNIDNKPAITYGVSANTPIYNLNKDIAEQTYTIRLNIWAKNSISSGDTLIDVESLMREQGYLLTSSIDIPDPDGYSHLLATFVY